MVPAIALTGTDVARLQFRPAAPLTWVDAVDPGRQAADDPQILRTTDP